MKEYFLKHRKQLGFIGGVLALCVAVTYLIIVPEEAVTAEGVSRFILMYAHSLCWFLLSPAIVLWGINKKPNLRATLAYSALGVYLVFIGTFLITKLF